MKFIIIFGVNILGLIVFSTSVINSIVILVFAIPFTKKLMKVNLLKTNDIIGFYSRSLLIQAFRLFIVTLIFYVLFRDTYFLSLIAGYFWGVFGVLFSFKKYRLNMDNFLDYYKVNKNYFYDEQIMQYNKNKDELLKFIIDRIDK